MFPFYFDLRNSPAHVPESVEAARVHDAPVLDGALDDAAWRGAKPSSAFTQKFPDERALPRDRTTVRIVYDDKAVYVAVDCEQRAAPVVARLARRDRIVEADRVSIALDTKRDGKSAFEFTVNAAGVLVDKLLFNDTEQDDAWDEVWDARARVREGGWSAEIKIPFRVLRYPALTSQDWGLQVRRYTSLTQEIDELAFIPRDAGGEVSRYGRLTHLEELPVTQSVELRPFVVAKYTQSQATDTTLGESKPGASAGLDAKWHPTPRLTLDAAVNPDFAQVEADRVIFNLTNLEIALPEKRPFFLEAADTYATPLPLLYTRRLGRVAPPSPTLGIGQKLVAPPQPASLYGALKLTGQLSDRTHVATLLAVEGENTVLVDDARGTRERWLLAPLTAAQVVRLKRDVGENAHIGFIATAKTRAESTGGMPAAAADAARRICPDGATTLPRERCFHDAYASGIDARWRSPEGVYTASGQVVGTLIANGPSRMLPDGTRIGPGDTGVAGAVRLAKEGGKPWYGLVSYGGQGRRVDYSDLGFMPRQNEHHVEAQLEYRTFEPWFHTLETRSKLELYGHRALDGLQLSEGYQINSWWKLENFWETFVEFHYRRERFDDREIGDGTPLERGGLLGLELEVATDARKAVRGHIFQTSRRLFSSAWVLDGEATVTVRTLPALDLEVGPQWSFTAGEPRYVSSSATALLFGELKAGNVGGTLRATYTFTPRVTLQAFAQLFLASGHYDTFSAYNLAPGESAPRVRLASLVPTAAPTTNPDFREAALNTSIVFRWEYMLGSTLFLVYSRAQVPNVALGAGERGTLDFGALRKAPASNIFLAKLTYFF